MFNLEQYTSQNKITKNLFNKLYLSIVIKP